MRSAAGELELSACPDFPIVASFAHQPLRVDAIRWCTYSHNGWNRVRQVFHPHLTFLQPPANNLQLPYSHWGGTDHGDPKSPRQRRGRALRLSGIHTTGLSRIPLSSLPAVSSAFALLPENLPVTREGLLFRRERIKSVWDGQERVGRTLPSASSGQALSVAFDLDVDFAFRP